MDAFWENIQRVPNFVLILMALYGHQLTYKNLRGNTACSQDSTTCMQNLVQGTCEKMYVRTIGFWWNLAGFAITMQSTISRKL